MAIDSRNHSLYLIYIYYIYIRIEIIIDLSVPDFFSSKASHLRFSKGLRIDEFSRFIGSHGGSLAPRWRRKANFLKRRPAERRRWPASWRWGPGQFVAVGVPRAEKQ